MVVELRRGAVKLLRWSSGTMGVRDGSSTVTRGSPAKKKERQWCLEAWGEWRAKERVEWKERELVKLLSQKRGDEGACTGVGHGGGKVAGGRATGRRGTRERGPGRGS
jgi:hypothetical protein